MLGLLSVQLVSKISNLPYVVRYTNVTETGRTYGTGRHAIALSVL